MASGFSILLILIDLLQKTLDPQLDAAISGLHLVHTLPTKKKELPIIAVSFADVHEKAAGLGGIIRVRQVPEQDTKILRANRIAGEIIFDIWVNKDDTNVQSKIDQAAGLLGDLLEEHQNDLRSHGLLKLEFNRIVFTESSDDASAWLINRTQALGRKIVYDFVFEYIAEEEPTEGIIEQIQINAATA
jgi:hypothetical protein